MSIPKMVPTLSEDLQIMFEDEKLDLSPELTNMEFVNKNRNFDKILPSDLEELFLVLRERCHDSWKPGFEERARELHKNFMILRNGRSAKHIDPDVHWSKEGKDYESEVENLLAQPEKWSMDRKEKAIELHTILHHFTMFAPHEGRPFIRAWLEALTPCVSRWILSYTSNEVVNTTLKYFLGAFGQPGIVVCLEDKGASLLKTLQHCAHSVEALGRGKVERYYWKSLAEATCGVREEWKQLESIKDIPLVKSQLDTLGKWLEEGNDWLPVFTSIVSPEVTEKFYDKIKKITGERAEDGWEAIPGPPKTRARTLAKACQYKAEFGEERNKERQKRFVEKFGEIYGREPSDIEDYIWNVVDLARCSITVPSARDVLEVKHMIELEFPVVCVKNGYSSDFHVTGSGYRDLKLLVEVEFEDLELAGIPRKDRNTTLICEIQILCNKWYENKKTTSISYKILRARSLCDLFYDCEKYAKPNSKENFLKTERGLVHVIKNGWVNIAKGLDYSNKDVDKLLITAIRKRWNKAGVRMLVVDLGANIEVRNVDGYTPLIMACKRGSDEVAKLLIELGCNIESRDDFSCKALNWAIENGREGCVKLLLEAKAMIEREEDRVSHDGFFKKSSRWSKGKNKRISLLLSGKEISEAPPVEIDVKSTQFDEMREAATEDNLGQFFDREEGDVPLSLISKLLASRDGVSTLKNILQVLWFGGDIKYKYLNRAPIHVAGKYGTTETIRVLLKFNANVNETQEDGSTALLSATRYASYDVVKLLLNAGAQVNAGTIKGLTPLIHALKYGTGPMVDLLFDFGADVNAGVSKLQTLYDCASANKKHSESVTDVLRRRCRVNGELLE